METYHEKNFQVRRGEYNSIIFPDTFSRGSHRRFLPTHPGIYPQNFIYHRTPYFDVIIFNGVL